jgi:hypothetical protein
MCQTEYRRDLERTQLPTIWTIPDEMCGRKSTPCWGRKKCPAQPGTAAGVFPPGPHNGILFVLRTAVATGRPNPSLLWFWLDGPPALSAVDSGRRDHVDAVVGLLLRWYDRCRSIDWEWQAADTKLLAAPLGGEATGPNPTDLGLGPGPNGICS